MLFSSKKTLQVELGDMHKEKEKLASFLNSKFKLNVTSNQTSLTVDSEKTSSAELEHAVNKFIYHQHLNRQYWVSTQGSTVKINKFQGSKKPEKLNKNPTLPKFAHGF